MALNTREFPKCYQEKLKLFQWVAVAICFLGIILIFNPLNIEHNVNSTILALASGFCWACGAILSKRIHIKYPKITANTNDRYFKGATKETSESLYDCVKNKFAEPPVTPIKTNKINSESNKSWSQNCSENVCH